MAANNYYASSYSPSGSNHIAAQNSEDLQSPVPQSSSNPPTSLYTNYQPSRTSYTAPPYSTSIDSPYDSSHPARDSYYSQATVDGAAQDDRQNGENSENIPLKPSQPDGLNTQYPPSPESQRPRQSSQRPRKKQGWFRGRITWVVFVTTLIQLGVFIAEIATNATKTGSPIMIHPSFNPMIGPSPYVLINMGARFVPCMRKTEGTQEFDFPCPESTSADADDPLNHCSLPKLCGFGAPEDESQPSQWYRFLIPMFLHAGIIHIGFNMLLQLTLGREMELEIGSLRFSLVYFSSGIFGFVLGGNFAPPAIASTGASGCLFGIFALVLLDLIYSWNERRKPGRELLIILIEIAIAFVLGLLPGLDNFSHIGGFLMGLVLGICILHSPNVLRQRIGTPSVPYEPMAAGDTSKKTGLANFARRPVGFFKGRKPAWWAWWFIRAGALIGVLVSFIVLLNNFYVYKNECSWCKHLSCLPISNWCDIGSFETTKDQQS